MAFKQERLKKRAIPPVTASRRFPHRAADHMPLQVALSGGVAALACAASHARWLQTARTLPVGFVRRACASFRPSVPVRLARGTAPSVARGPPDLLPPPCARPLQAAPSTGAAP
eukprot:scaffold2507_cov255-Prasinococcus_capsulatus_cf.AAC.1